MARHSGPSRRKKLNREWSRTDHSNLNWSSQSTPASSGASIFSVVSRDQSHREYRETPPNGPVKPGIMLSLCFQTRRAKSPVTPIERSVLGTGQNVDVLGFRHTLDVAWMARFCGP